MRKADELSDPNSCLNKNTTDNTILFVLKDRDLVMADTIRYWASKRIEKGLNDPLDEKILSALRVADEVEMVQLHRNRGQ